MGIIYEQLGSVAVLRIDRPKALNALNRDIVDKMDTFLTGIKGDKEIKALILYGKDNFAAGADIKAMVQCTEREAKAFSFSDTFNKLAALDIPTIAAIEGYALGGGLELALACDLRIAAEDSKMGFPEINLGIMPGAGGTIRAPKLIGAARTKELILTGETISAEKALDMGLVNRVVEKEAVWEAALKLAEKLGKKAPIALAAAKKTIDRGLEQTSVEAGIAMEADNWAALFNTQDQKEGMKAFLEKRKPEYTGK
ncbi:enoyl-CoA hydratase/isomerase family protein [bacterium 210820-DFI.6.37]|nr:enoyl-CoA hydratase/isomerase family protein [bacterium 210820-DFI.6.37]